MRGTVNTFFRGSIPLDTYKSYTALLKAGTASLIKIKLKKGTWSSLVYGTRLENENLIKVVSSNLTVPVVFFNIKFLIVPAVMLV